VTIVQAKPGVAELNGLPFLDDAFTGSRLLAMTAALRHAAARQRLLADAIVPGDAEAWLAPALAFGLSTSSTPMPALPLTAARRQMIADVLATLAGQLPQWTLLLGLPVRYARLYPSRGAISASSHDWPQHVLLADEAFATSRELREQLLHELAHQWLYLIEYIWPLEVPGAGTLTLPSGTRNRSPAEVLGAAHVAAVLVRLYRTAGTPQSASRVSALTAYGTGCLDLVGTASGDMTAAGTLIAQRLKEAF
jgi:hypothetical protein